MIIANHLDFDCSPDCLTVHQHFSSDQIRAHETSLELRTGPSGIPGVVRFARTIVKVMDISMR